MPGERVRDHRARAVRVDGARHLDDRVAVEAGERPAVTYVEDQGGALVLGDRAHQRECDVLVPAGAEVGGGTLARAGHLAVLGHVGGLTTVPGGLPRLQRGAGAAGGARVEVTLLVQDERAAALGRGAHRGDGVAVEVVVVQVFVGHGADRAQPLAAEQAALLERRQRGVVGQEPGQQVMPADAYRPQPAQVVEPGVVEPRARRVDAEGGGDAAAEPDRRVTDADHPVAEVSRHRLGDQTCRVGEVDDPRPGSTSADPPGDVDRDRNRAQAVGDAARADRLLAEHALIQCHTLVGRPALEPADAYRREDEVGAVERPVEVGGDGDRGRVGGSGRLLGEHLADHLRPHRVQVMQDHFGDAALALVTEQGTVDQRDTEPPAAEHGQSHASITSMPHATGRAHGTSSSGRSEPTSSGDEIVH